MLAYFIVQALFLLLQEALPILQTRVFTLFATLAPAPLFIVPACGMYFGKVSNAVIRPDFWALHTVMIYTIIIFGSWLFPRDSANASQREPVRRGQNTAHGTRRKDQ